ncbi:lysine biosynthesis protein LysW [Streptomyces roseicoloratus]|uniref:Lysine biosynthesis protein LysW n=1 Tax=Streptomyces roseicoloratus TaxID=2508722 RepID=A0ABY9RR91_9ACTN|nr:lysine biosynthesis protein LysW [Streptomyces roseicoloratus]WMX43996.1 lysine biosynthesis protein LysW [Streptomyces roseicoloratus]
MTTATTQACPECEDEVQLSPSVRLNEIVECAGCRSELEIVALSPAVLALAPEVEEDWGE